MWAEHHPGVVLPGALLMAILALQKSRTSRNLDLDPNLEEVTLFI